MERSELQGLSILVVDDEDGLRDAISIALSSRGATITQTTGGRLALELVKAGKFDWVISDIRMPDGDGLSLLEGIHTLTKDIPKVILVTGFADVTVDQVLKKGAIALLPKPFGRRTLIELVLNNK